MESSALEDGFDYLSIDGYDYDEGDSFPDVLQLDDNTNCSFISTDGSCRGGCGDLNNPSGPGFVLRVEEIPWIPCETPNCYI